MIFHIVMTIIRYMHQLYVCRRYVIYIFICMFQVCYDTLFISTIKSWSTITAFIELFGEGGLAIYDWRQLHLQEGAIWRGSTHQHRDQHLIPDQQLQPAQRATTRHLLTHHSSEQPRTANLLWIFTLSNTSAVARLVFSSTYIEDVHHAHPNQRRS